jgi:Fic family protein
MQRDDLPVIVQAALAHAQFETIHPFADGNGRTGRAIVHALLRGKGLVKTTTAPVSAGLLRQTTRYFEALDSYRRGDGRPIIERFCDASRFAADSGTRLVDQLGDQVRQAHEKMAGVRSSSLAWHVIPHLVANPVMNARLLIDRFGMRQDGAQRALATLTELAVVEERTGMRRNRVWQHPGILAVLDNYAAGLRRT